MMRMTTGIERLKTICGALHPGGIVRMPHERLRGIIEQIERETVPTPEWPDDSGLPEGMRVLAVLVWRDGGDHSEVHLTKQNYDWFCWLHEHGGPERIEKRLMPKGMEWPRYEDDRLVDIADMLEEGMVVGIEMRTEGYCITCLNGSIQKPYGERIRRPALAADGEIVREGETVWNAATGEEFKVVDARDGYAYLSTDGGAHVNVKLPAGAVTHVRPVLDADNVPIHDGDTLYAVKTGRSCKVLKAVTSRFDDRVPVEFDAPELDEEERTIFCPVRFLTHQPPVRDANDVLIRPGDVVYANADASGDGTAWRVVRIDPKRAHSVHAEREHGRAVRRDLVPEWLTHEPDTWERIEEDAANLDEMPCDFNAKDLVRRCKRLAEKGA